MRGILTAFDEISWQELEANAAFQLNSRQPTDSAGSRYEVQGCSGKFSFGGTVSET